MLYDEPFKGSLNRWFMLFSATRLTWDDALIVLKHQTPDCETCRYFGAEELVPILAQILRKNQPKLQAEIRSRWGAALGVPAYSVKVFLTLMA
jgi:hypothetical protein